MKIKEGVSLRGLQLEMRVALIEASKIWANMGHELVITSGLEGVHSPSSLHPFGFALDFRTSDMTEENKLSALFSLQNVLEEPYRVIKHDTHIHVEYRIMDKYKY